MSDDMITMPRATAENMYRLVADLSLDGRRFRALVGMLCDGEQSDVDRSEARIAELNPQSRQEFSAAIDTLMREGLLFDPTLPSVYIDSALLAAQLRQHALTMAEHIKASTWAQVYHGDWVCCFCNHSQPIESLGAMQHSTTCPIGAAFQVLENEGDT